MTIELTEEQKDIFNEMGNVGVGNAATALSTMVNQKVNIDIPSTDIVKKEEIIKETDDEILVVTSKLEGELTGSLVVIYNKKTAFPLIDLLLGQEKGTLKEIDEMAKSVFKEMVNVIAGPYLDSLSDMTNIRLLPRPPTFSYGKLLSVKDGVMKELPDDVEDVIYVKSEMAIEGEVIFGDIYLVLNKESLEKLLNLLSGGGC